MLKDCALNADPVFNGVAIPLIFGIPVFTVLTLVVIPRLYFVAYRNRLGALGAPVLPGVFNRAAWWAPYKQMAPHFVTAAQQMPEVRFAKADSGVIGSFICVDTCQVAKRFLVPPCIFNPLRKSPVKMNVGTLDRLLRIGAGVALIRLAVAG